MKQPEIIPIGALGTRPRKAGRGAVVISVPGEDVTSFGCPVPEGVKAHVARNIALNNALDRVAGAAEAHHFTVLPAEGDMARVLVVAREKLEGWRAELAAAGLRAPQVLPDYLCLPWTPGTITIAKQPDDRLSVRSGTGAGYSAETALGLEMLSLLRPDRDAALEHVGVWPAEAMEDKALTAALEDWKLPLRIAGPPVPLPPVSLISGGGLSDALGTGRARARLGLIAAGLAAVAIWALNAQADLADARALRDDLRAENMRQAREVFGLAGPILDLRIQVARQLDALRGAQAASAPTLGFADLLRPAGPVLAREEVQVVELHYDEGRLRFVVRVSDFAELDSLRRDLAQLGLAADVRQSVREGGEGVRAELHLSAAAREG